MKLVAFALLVLSVGCAKGDPCVEMQEAIDDNANRPCAFSEDCTAIPCACADGSVVTTTSCVNNQCGGLDACEDTCGDVDPECSATGSSGGGTCCVYTCSGGGGLEATGATSSATDEQSCRDAANEFCGTSFSLTCSMVLQEQCSDTSECVE